MIRHLWVGAPMPADYLELYLARDVYHTWPLPDAMTVAKHLTCLSAETEVRKRRG